MTEFSSDLLGKFEVGRFEQARNKAPMSHKANAEMQESFVSFINCEIVMAP